MFDFAKTRNSNKYCFSLAIHRSYVIDMVTKFRLISTDRSVSLPLKFLCFQILKNMQVSTSKIVNTYFKETEISLNS